MMGGAGMMGGMGVWTFLFPLLALFAVAALLVFGAFGIRALAEDASDETADAESDEDPVERLKRRYAEGELTEAEFERALERELSEETGGTESGLGEVGSDRRARSEPARER
ncbi:SHOCT domain-containing protein [Halorubrum ejinorense]|uniref:SHOCT domain-containing protein n=1 Tax=Halorubrum ejinorense TaxID=425309 RepID=A0AAV3SQ17_9EURY